MMDTGILPHITVGCFGGESFQAADQKTDFSYFDSTLEAVKNLVSMGK